MTKEGIWGTEVLNGVQGQSPGGGLGSKLQKPETHAEYSTEQRHRSSQIAYCLESHYTLKKSATTGRRAKRLEGAIAAPFRKKMLVITS